MCGIIGFAATSAISASASLEQTIITGRDAMTHRGPDDAGLWWSEDRRVLLAQRRLAVIDLSPAGHQPMQDSDGEITITFNGEIYNFSDISDELAGFGARFRSSSDTEVILEAYKHWGMDFLEKLEGMFAFALHDARRGTLLLARDRAGEKPLFYLHGNGSLAFSSELKGLLADPGASRQIDPIALDCYLGMGYVPGERCILSGYAKLAPAHVAEFDLATGQLRTWRYWDLPAPPSRGSAMPVDELVDELDRLLETSVRRQLVADVPVGILLSGGVDSSLITAMAARARDKIKTFTIRMPQGSNLDESPHARLIANHFGTDHQELEAETGTVDLLPELARQFDEPMSDSSMIPTYLVSRMVRKECTVALGGDGGDELFGGYLHHSRLLWMQRRLGPIPLVMRRAISNLAETLMPQGTKGRNWLRGLGVDLTDGLPLMAVQFDPAARNTLLGGKPLAPSARVETLFSQTRRNYPDLLERTTRADFEHYLPEDILVKVDRASMLTSLEMRAPMLDKALIEFAFGQVPSTLKADEASRKILLKRLTERLLPREFDRNRKQGFSIPLGSWLKGGPFRDLFHDVLGASDCIFDKTFTQALLRGQDAGRANNERLFTLVMFELWRKQYGAAL